MVGLGPLTPTYAIIASRVHARSLADLALTQPTAVAEIAEIRRRLESERGPLLMTEHGRVPVCRADGDQHDQHCFHGHALLFDCEGLPLKEARTYYSRCVECSNVDSALRQGANEESYTLISPSSSQYQVLAGPLNVPRQLTRSLVALVTGETALADWRLEPRRQQAVELASTLRRVLGEP